MSTFYIGVSGFTPICFAAQKLNVIFPYQVVSAAVECTDWIIQCRCSTIRVPGETNQVRAKILHNESLSLFVLDNER